MLLLFIEGLTGTENVSFEKICGIFFASIVIPYFLSSLVRLTGFRDGKYIVLLPILGAFTSDVFALLVGKAIGKHKLCPEISPNKTVEGSIGGVVMAPVILIIYSIVLQNVYGFTVNYFYIILYGIASAFAGQLGDLSMSFVKRQFHIKDFGNIIPGHGGILDRFDSILFSAPLIELLVILLPAIVR